MVIVRFILLVLALLPKAGVAQATTDGNIVEKINARAVDDQDPDSLSLFRNALHATGMLDGFLGNHSALFTVFAPTNQAFYDSPQLQLYMTGLDEKPFPRWHQNLKNALKQHIVADGNGTFLLDDIFDLQRESLPSLTDPIVLNQFEARLQDAKIIEKNVTASNGVLHVVDKVLRPLFFDQTFAQLELQTELGPDELKRTAMTDVVDFVDARNILNHVNDAGTTFIGCRIRAFNRLEEYLPQTLNDSPNGVIFGEFLNETYKNETIHNFIEYNLIPKNYYSEDIPNDNKFVELTVPIANCGHMWVTKRDGKLCFNNGCVVDDPEWREYSASNGVGYVLDKCQVCHGIAMLVDVAYQFTMYNTGDYAQLLGASEWNRRDLRLSIGNGTDITMFASINTGWDFFNRDDMLRITTDMWKTHMLNLLEHTMVQGIWTKIALYERYEQIGPFDLTSLAGEPIRVDFSAGGVEGGDLFFPDIQGVDGLVHLTSEVPLPISVTHTIYDIAKENPDFSTHILYIDTVRLDTDMKRLSPMTAMYAPNADWENVVTDMDKIADTVLKSHMFEELLWCDTLVEMSTAGIPVVSLNMQNWTITVNEEGFPCFESPLSPEGTSISCITECNILARNGIVHKIDHRLEFEATQTAPPQSGPTGTGTNTAANDPSVFQRPTGATTGGDSSAPADGLEIGDGEGEASSTVAVFSMSITVAMASIVVLLSSL